MAARVLTSNDVRREIDEVLTELREDRTASELEAALGHGATVTVVGWSIQAAQGLVRRGDVTVLVGGLVGGLEHSASPVRCPPPPSRPTSECRCG